VKELRIDGYTGYTTCQGGMFKSDVSTPNGPIRLRRANFRDTAGQCGFISWVSSSGNTNLYTDGTNGFYVDGYASRPWPSQVLWPQNASTGTDADGTYAYYPSLNGSGSSGQMWRKWDGSANGQIRKGVPPLGDFVPTGSVGVGYVSPGYQ
jgi:hypothetical protein